MGLFVLAIHGASVLTLSEMWAPTNVKGGRLAKRAVFPGFPFFILFIVHTMDPNRCVVKNPDGCTPYELYESFDSDDKTRPYNISKDNDITDR